MLARRFRDAGKHVDLALIVSARAGDYRRADILHAGRSSSEADRVAAGISSTACFFGLIVASIVVLFHSLGDIRPIEWIAIAGGSAIGFGIVNLAPVSTPDAPWFIALCGTLAVSAMLLPGVSGSFVLLILRKYAYVFDGIGRLDLGIVIPFRHRGHRGADGRSAALSRGCCASGIA